MNFYYKELWSCLLLIDEKKQLKLQLKKEYKKILKADNDSSNKKNEN